MIARSLAPLLSPLALAYAGGVRLRSYLYRSGRLARRSLAHPVLSVGNLVVGGTGKTPLVAALARDLRDRGRRVAVLSRGYGRRTRGLLVVADFDRVLADPAEGGDEAVLVARETPGVAVVVAEDRALAGAHAERALGADVHVLDDGYQHLGLARTLDVLLLDATRDHRTMRLLPAGPLREPLAAAGRADVILLSRAHQGDADGLEELIRRYNPGAPVLRVDTRPLALERREGGTAPLAELAGLPVLALSGIGNPDQFEADLRALGATLVATARFRDHHVYSRRDLERVQALARQHRAVRIVTTTKDLVRLETLPAASLPVVALRVEAVVREREVWLQAIARALGAGRGGTA